MNDNFDDVGDFHEKFDLPVVRDRGWLQSASTLPHQTFAERNQALMNFRIKFMHEELREFEDGYADGDIDQMADALVDLAYVVFGTAHILGLPWHALWDDVQRANMTKERAAADGSNSKRGSSFDVVKPAGWVGPDTHAILEANGFHQ